MTGMYVSRVLSQNSLYFFYSAVLVNRIFHLNGPDSFCGSEDVVRFCLRPFVSLEKVDQPLDVFRDLGTSMSPTSHYIRE